MGPNLSCFTKPVYVEVDRSGPPHRHVFTVRCSVTYYTLSEPRGIGTLSREGVANSKKDARQAAADYTLQALVALSADKETRPDGVSPLYPVTTGSGPGALPQQQPAFTQQDATVAAQDSGEGRNLAISYVGLLQDFVHGESRPQAVLADGGPPFVAHFTMGWVAYPKAVGLSKADAKEGAAKQALQQLGCLCPDADEPWGQPRLEGGGAVPGAGGAVPPAKSAVSRLVEHSQRGEFMPKYTCTPTASTLHDQRFSSSCQVLGITATGHGPSMKTAREASAKQAWAMLRRCCGPEARRRMAEHEQRQMKIGDASAACPLLVGGLEPVAGEMSRMPLERRMVALVQERLEAMYDEAWRREANLPPRDSVVIAAFIQTWGSDMSAVSVATGTKHLDSEHWNAPADGLRLVDSHAEVLARRALVRYLAAMVAKDAAGEESVFRDGVLREGVEFHLYVSTEPCGDARRFHAGAGSKRKHPGSALSIHCANLAHPEMGKLCTKILAGMGASPTDSSGTAAARRVSMSCSEKVLKWAVCGLQGSLLLSVLREPVVLTSVVLGSDGSRRHHAERALCCRAPAGCVGLRIAYSPKLQALGSNARSSAPNVCCLNWVKGDPAGTEVTNGATGQRASTGSAAQDAGQPSRLCKAALAKILVGEAKVGMCHPGESYRQWKHRVASAGSCGVSHAQLRQSLENVRGTPWVHACGRHADFLLNPC